MDRDSGEPVGRNRDVADAARARGVELELELTTCQVEIATPVCDSSTEVLAELRRLRQVVADAADEVGVGVVAIGVPPTVPHHFPVTDTPRYRQIGERFGMLAHEQGICGCHIHVAMPNREVAVAVSNHLRWRLPILTALAANSAIYRDADTGHASWRSVLWSRWPTSGPPPHLRSVEHFDDLASMLVSSRAILDDHMVYWDIRPSDHFPTIEIRIGDVQTRSDEAVTLAAIVRALVVVALDDIENGVPAPVVESEVLNAATWKAAHDGIEGDAIDVISRRPVPVQSLLTEMITDLGPVLDRLGDRALIDSRLIRIREEGNGATRQRRQHAAGATGRDIVRAAAEAFTV